MDSAPLGKVLNEDNETGSEEGKNEEFIKFRKESSSKKVKVQFIKLGRKKQNPSRRDKILRKHQTMRKKEKAIKIEKTSTKKRKKEKKGEKCECKNFHQVVREYWFIERDKGHEIPWKIIQVENDEQKWRFIKSKI